VTPVTPALEILGEHQGLIFVHKPAGIQTEPDVRHSDVLLTRLAAQLGIAANRLHALSRLDTGVSGVVTFGLSSESRRLVQGWRERGVFRRRYVALASGVVREARGVWAESIGRAAGNLRAINGRHSEAARTRYALVDSTPPALRAIPESVHLLALSPVTGRTHQLRVHASAHGLPLLGDRGYGGVSRLILPQGAVRGLDRVALHAAWVELPLAEPRRIHAPIAPELREIWASLGGAEAAWAEASAAELSEE